MTAHAAFRFAKLVLLADRAETTVTLPIECEAPSNFTVQLTARRTLARQPSCLPHRKRHGVTPAADRSCLTTSLVAAAVAPL